MPELADISALIVLGGPMGANDDHRYQYITELKQLIRRVVAADIPCLGICLGGQLLAAALGAKVATNRWEEQGTATIILTAEGRDDQLFRGIGEEFHSFEWHRDSFDIPAGGILLAASAVCPHQAFRVGKSAWGIQFHPEVSTDIIRDWCSWDSDAAARQEELLAAFKEVEAAYITTAQQLVTNFLAITGLEKSGAVS